MALLIDGYNFIFGTAVESRGGGTALARMRAGLVDFLATKIDRAKYKTITVVYDANNAPPGLADLFHERGIEVRFARNHRDADEMLEELIAASHAPGRLTVVSSDHRVQRAAKRRGATAVDSDQWFREQLLHRVRKERQNETKPGPPTSGETAAWLRFFGEFEVAEAEPGATATREGLARRGGDTEKKPAATEEPDATAKGKRKTRKPAARSEKDFDVNLGNPFPPGYGEDLLDGE